jgi:PKD repeat protein
MLDKLHRTGSAYLIACIALLASVAHALPPGFAEAPIGGSWNEVSGLAWSSDGTRLYVVERGGKVWIVENGVRLPTPFLDISDEVGAWRDFGLLGFALHPNFEQNGYVYALFVVDRYYLFNHGTPAYDPAQLESQQNQATIGRLARFTADPATGRHTVLPGSEVVLLGETPTEGIPILHQSHGTGQVVFGQDGTLLMSAGDGASYDVTDTGSATGTFYTQALVDGIIKSYENVGAWRSQELGSLNGKILRLDPNTGNGVSSNPFYDPAAPRSARSRVYALGLRNPYRFTLRPNTGSHDPADGDPGTFYVGDVGWNSAESLHILDVPGENFGWPAFEGLNQRATATPDSTTTYWNAGTQNPQAKNPLAAQPGCSFPFLRFRDLIVQETRNPSTPPSWPNPCNAGVQIPDSWTDPSTGSVYRYDKFVHSRPPISWRGDAWVATFDASGNPTFATMGTGTPIPGPDFSGNTSTGGVWYTGTDFPAEWQNSYFHGDYGAGWIKNFGFDANDRLLDVVDFLDPGHSVTFITTNPVTGRLYYVNWGSTVSEIRWVGTGNTPPTAVAAPAVSWSLNSQLAVQFSGAGSSDPDAGSLLTYLWNFGDGTTSTQRDPLHTFNAVGTNPQTFPMTLTVRDQQGNTGVAQAKVSLRNSPPQVAITQPQDGGFFSMAAPSTVQVRSSVSDAQSSNANLSCTLLVELVHNTHTHPDPPINACAADVQITPAGCDGNTYAWRFTLTVTDPQGLATSKSASLYPDCSTLPNQPPGAQNDTAGVVRGGSVVVDVLANDTDPDGLLVPSSVTIASPPASGSVQVNPQTGAITYTHNGGAATSDSFRYTVADDDGAPSNVANVAVTVSNNASLVAAYAFEEASGNTATDSSGNGNNGTLSGATRSASGKIGSALVFNGSGALVTIPDSNSLDLTTAMTLEAWVFPTATGGWRDVIYKGPNDTYYLEGSSDAGPPAVGGTFSGNSLFGNAALQSNTWSHLAATYDGATLRLYVNGAQVASRPQTGAIPASSGALSLGGDALYGQYFAGRLDEVRIYRRVLSAAEIQSDMVIPIGGTPPPNQPPIASASGTPTTGPAPLAVSFSSAGSSDPEGAPLTYAWTFGDGGTSTSANPSHTYITPGSYSARLTVSDGVKSTQSSAVAISVGAATNQPPIASASGTPTSGPAPLAVGFSSAGSSDPEGAPLSYAWTFGDGGTSTAASPSHTYASPGSYNARLTVSDGVNSTQSSIVAISVSGATNQPPVATAAGSPTSGPPPLLVNFSSAGSFDPEGTTLSYAWTFGDGGTSTAANPAHTYATSGSYNARLSVSDGVNTTLSSTIPITVTSAASGLVAAYGFEEASGSSVVDASGNANHGTLSGATRTVSGKFGSALTFSGANALVSIPDASSLDLTSAMTLEAWVFPIGVGGWRDVVYKGPNDTYYLEGSSDLGGAPAMGGNFSGGPLYSSAGALTPNAWSHLAATYDGATLRLFVNGAQVASRSQSGSIPTSSGPLTLGGDPLFGQYFAGRIDEVRVYGRALGVAEIQADMNTPVSSIPQDSTPPNVSITSPAAGSTVSHVPVVQASASDNVGVVGVDFFADGSPIGSDTSAPYTASWNTTTLSNGTHLLTAVARDPAGNQRTSAAVQVTTANPGFVNEVVVPDITAATTIAFLPDGRMLVGEITENVWVVPQGASAALTTPFLSLDASLLFGEQGLMDVLPDPAFAQNGWYYVFYTHGAPSGNRNRVSRFTASGNATVAGSEVVLWEDDVAAQNEHHGGTLAFGPDGKLYISSGDQFNAPDAQLLTSFHGKILRINKDGSVPTDNPFYDGNGPNKDAIWAYGLRNPFRMSFDSATGRLYIGDVGGNDPNTAIEEVNLGAAGANYGWPLCEGSCGSPGTTGPIYSYPHLGRDASITGGFVYRGTQLGSEYAGSYFFADYVQNWIKRLIFDASGNVVTIANFWPADGTPDTAAVGDPVKLVPGPDGALYYVDIGFNDQHVPNPAAIRRIRAIGGNQPPTVVANATPRSGAAPLAVAFSSAGSSDPEGQPLSYAWSFGDGATSTAANPSHTYTASGQYVARLSLSDGTNTALSPNIAISVGNPPSAQITSPATGGLFRAGDVISYAGTATDPEDGALPASAFSWTILFHHDSHVHPGGGPFTGTKSGSFAIPFSGHDFEGNTSYEIVLTVTDSSGLSTSTSVTIFPDKVNLTFDSVPSGLGLDIDGIRKQTPFVLDDIKGFQHTINAPPQTAGGSAYRFVSWSDGGAQSHGITVPNVAASYTATFQQGVAGLVGAWGFEEASGSAVNDASGAGNQGTLSGATRTTAGKIGSALVFNGTSALVNVPDSSSLDLTSAMTLEAWVYPTAGGKWQDVIYKSNDLYYIEGSSPSGRPAAGGTFGSDVLGSAGLPLNTWSHIAATYDRTTLRLYVNGTQVGSKAQTNPIQTSTGALTFGGDAIFGQYFAGRIDEVRIYNRALTAAEIQADMTRAVP